MALTISGLWAPLWAYTSLSTQSFGAGLLRLTRCTIPNDMKTVQIEVTTGGSTTLRVGYYTDTPTGPGTLVGQTGDISGAAAAALTSALSIPAGTYWLAVQNTGAAACTLRTAGGMNPFLPGLDPPGTNNSPNTWGAASQGTAFPGTFPMASVIRNGLFPSLFVQAV
jgi:hypothetical protein